MQVLINSLNTKGLQEQSGINFIILEPKIMRLIYFAII